MNKNAIKTYAIWARNELITRVTQKAFEYGVSKENIIDINADSINGKLLTAQQKKQRQELINDVNNKGFDQVIEEVSYTWFNRFIALRYMEINNYLPNRIRIFTNENNEFKPQILDEAMNIELEGLDKELVFELIEKNKTDELYKQLLIATCNDMGNYLPGMFTKISDYKVLLFPDNITKKENVIGRLISDIDEDSWLEQVQIIGWLYQYYISQKHDEVVGQLKNNIKKEDIPAATQLFTTDWVVRYMVDNSLGRYWIERHPESQLKDELNFLVTDNDNPIEYINETVNPEELSFIDNAMGSGHILVYAFEVLMKIYLESGYSEREAALSIIENNLYGLDIDERAYQLAYFSIMMMGRKYNRRIFSKRPENHLMAIQETKNIPLEVYDLLGEQKEIALRLHSTFYDAKNLGSIINVHLTESDLDELEDKIKSLTDSNYNLLVMNDITVLNEEVISIIKEARIMVKKYAIVSTNPPYLSKFNNNIKKYLLDNYKDFSGDMFSVFMFNNMQLLLNNGFAAFMTPNVWMFLRSYEKLRTFIVNEKNVSSLIQMAKGSFFKEATVDICTFVLRNAKENTKGIFIRLENFKGDMSVQKKYVLEAKNSNVQYKYNISSEQFKYIPNKVFAYWFSNNIIENFCKNKLSDITNVKAGLTTAGNDLFIRNWYEVNCKNIEFNQSPDKAISNKKWFITNKGGSYNKWYGNNDSIIDWENNGERVKKNPGATIRNKQFYFKECITWSNISSGKSSFRYKPIGTIPNAVGPSIYDENNLLYFLGLLNSNFTDYILEALAPTIHFEVGQISNIPVIVDYENKDNIEKIVKENILYSKCDWDSFELSWDFSTHPLIKKEDKIEESFNIWDKECTERFYKLKKNEEELNQLFIDIYKMNKTLCCEESDTDVSVRKANVKREMISLISYAVGCMFGRYSLDEEGLVYAGGTFDITRYKSFIPDTDNIIPICDDEYFSDDIVGRFIEFIKVAYGESTLEENLDYIANALGGKGTSREILRNYFLNDFFKDHCNTYQVTGSGKRPIYWLFDSGKKNGFKALIYIHRYTPDLIARMRTQYIHEQQSRYRNQIDMLEKQIQDDISTSERVRLSKQLKKFKEQDEELRVYEEKIHYWADKMEPMELDDGVKVNYAKFQELLAKIK